MTSQDYTHWLSLARRYSRRPDEAEDLLHDALLAAAEKERVDFTLEENRRWFTGVIRNLAAMTARSEVRRKDRESRIDPMPSSHDVTTERDTSAASFSFLHDLSPAIRRVALLILHGMTRTEIEFVLHLSPTAYRQRLTSLRKALRSVSHELRVEEMALAYQRRVEWSEGVQLGFIRRALLTQLRRKPGVGTHDPDGYPLLIR